MNYKCVFLDLDDTIWDFHVNAKSTLNEIYELRKLYKYFSSFEEYFEIYYKRNLELWDLYGKGKITKDTLNRERFLYPMLQVGINDPKMAVQIGIEYLEMLPSRTALVPHAKELLEYLYLKYPLTIISNGFTEVQSRKINSSGIALYFKHIVLSEEVKLLKPDQRIFEHALTLNNATAGDAIMIGDSYEADIAGAQNAKIDQIYFNRQQTNTSPQCTFVVKNLEEIFTIL
jgi:HAD superfamily (subfamily IA) hydrolase, TIGR02254